MAKLNQVGKARIRDAEQMHKLINYYADKGEMLARPLSEIYENIRDYFVVRQGERVIACAALHVNWLDLAEIKSLAVAEDNRHQGIGAQLVGACREEAKQLGIATIFCLTYNPAFFEKFGFSQVDKAELPRKVWTECYRCPKFPDCDEVALVSHLEVEG
jgi:amino-acid N-acetyltransferase